ncbi:MAG: hypothetical protein DRG83_09335, partial [Deltaproteobacteria bacterium]
PTPGFSSNGLDIASYKVPLDTAAWDALAFYDISWRVEALSDAEDVSSIMESSNTRSFKLQPSQSVTLTSPVDGAALNKSIDDPPEFKWSVFQGAATYDVYLAHVSGVGFDVIRSYTGEILNVFSMDAYAWQQMPVGIWYWTVIAKDAGGAVLTPNFAVFKFSVQ